MTTSKADGSRPGMLSAVKWTTASNITGELLAGSVTFVLAALLSPRQFGTVAIAYIYVTFVDMIVGFGFGTALIQRTGLRKIHLDSVFWCNLALGVGISVAAVLCSGWWARAYQLPDLKSIIIVLSSIIPIRCLGQVQTAYLQKNMDFKSLAIRDNVAAGLGGVVGIVLAVAGFGAWALVWQHIARESIGATLLWRLSEWRPRAHFSWAAVRDLFDYAWKVFAGRVANFAQSETDSLLIGLLLGPAALGLYRIANRLVEMNLRFLPRAVQVVSVPHFAGLQNDLPELNRTFIKCSHLNAMVTFPGMAFLAGASPIILAAIGPKWLDAAMVLRILAIIGVSKAMILLVGPLLQALSRPGINSINTWVLAVANSAAVCATAWGFSHSTEVQQISLVAAMRAFVFVVVFTPLLLWQARRASGLSLAALLKAMFPAAITSLIVGGSQVLLSQSGIGAFMANRFATLFFSAMLAFLTWVACLRVLDRVAWQYAGAALRKGGYDLRRALFASR